MPLPNGHHQHHHHQQQQLATISPTGNTPMPAASMHGAVVQGNTAQMQSSTPNYQFVPTPLGNSSSPNGHASLVAAGGPSLLPGGPSLPPGGSSTIPGATNSPPTPPTKIVGIAQGQFELQYWTGQQYSTAFVSPLQLPHWLQQHDISALTIPTAPQMPSATTHTPTILGVTQGEFQVQYWNDGQYSTTLVQPLNLLSWLEQQGSYTVDAGQPPVPAGAS